MKIMKHIIPLVLLLILVCSITACGNNEPKVEYYTGTNVATFTSVTNIELDKTEDGKDNWSMYDYYCEASDVDKYVASLKSDGFTDANMELGEGIYCLEKGNNNVIIAYADGKVAIYPRVR